MPCDDGISGCNASIELFIGRAFFEHAADTQTRMLPPCLEGPVDVAELVVASGSGGRIGAEDQR